ncbi:MAG: thiamine phosphate synthase [Candidatus Gastranaerophilales bacterium]|nr:thiamine phosphate synthase [Candidatus Gastranaerophilales bacterium]
MNIKDAQLKNKNKAIWIDSQNFCQDLILNTAGEVLNNGIKIIQYNFKTAPDKQNIEVGIKLRQLCSIFEALLFINSRADIAQIIEADGLCLFDDDMSLNQARKIFHNDIILAKYIETQENITEAIQNNTDIICINSAHKAALMNNMGTLNKVKIVEVDRKFI